MINGVASTAESGSSSASGVFDGMGSDAFLKLLIAQLKYQDPLEPTGAAEMMAQTSQMASMEAMQKQTAFQEQNLGFQQFSVATSMLGTEVTAMSGDETVTGVVVGVRATDSGPRLQLDSGFEVDVNYVVHVATRPQEPELSNE